jgi:hypothetical protein
VRQRSGGIRRKPVKKRKEGEEKKDGFAISGRGRFLPDNFTARAGERERERERERNS